MLKDNWRNKNEPGASRKRGTESPSPNGAKTIPNRCKKKRKRIPKKLENTRANSGLHEVALGERAQGGKSRSTRKSQGVEGLITTVASPGNGGKKKEGNWQSSWWDRISAGKQT